MAAILKMEDGKVVVSDGFPVLVYEDGREAPLDFNALIGKVKEKTDQWSAADTKAKALEARLGKFGVPDEEIAAAVEFAKANKGKKVGNEDEIRERVAAAVKSAEDEKRALESKVAGLTSRHESFLIEQAFSSPEVAAVLNERKCALTPSIVRKMFAEQVAVVDGEKVVPFRDPAKKDRVFSRTRHGEEANLAEAIGEWISTHPERERFTLGTGAAGGGAPGGGKPSGVDLSALSPEDRLTAGFAAGAKSN